MPFYSTREGTEEEQQFINYIEELYFSSTCKETCQILQLPYSQKIQKLFHQAFPKQAGWGGKRKGSGQKKALTLKTIIL